MNQLDRLRIKLGIDKAKCSSCSIGQVLTSKNWKKPSDCRKCKKVRDRLRRLADATQ